MKRYASIIRLHPEAEAAYKVIHRAVWPEVLKTVAACNIRNYSIFIHEQTLFGYFEYVGVDISADKARMASDAKTQEWWSITNPMQNYLPDLPEGEWWTPIEEVFHTN